MIYFPVCRFFPEFFSCLQMIFNKISLDFSAVAQPWLGQLKNDWSLHRRRLRPNVGTECERVIE